MVIIRYVFYLTFLFFFKTPQPSYCIANYRELVTDLWNKYTLAFLQKMHPQPHKQWVDNLVKNHKVLVFSKSYCPHCNKAKEALKEANVEFHAEELDSNPNMEVVMDYLLELTGARTVPRVFVKGKFYGDSSKTVADVESGEFLKHYTSTEL